MIHAILFISEKHNEYVLPIANAVDKKHIPNNMTDPKAKLKQNNRAYDAREIYHQMPTTHHRSSSSGRNSTKTDTKYTERHEYKRPNTILDPYEFRQASDTDVNYQIIKKTLNKEIPTPSFNRKNADLNASLSLTSRIQQNAIDMNVARKDKIAAESRLVYLDSKQPHEIYQEKLAKQNELKKLQNPSHGAYHQAQSMENHMNYESRATSHSASVSNHQYLGKNHQHQQKTMSQGPNHVPYETPVRPKLEVRKENPTPPPRKQPTNLSVNDVSSTRSTSVSLFGPIKRESPLDLSVKTVKTKADSTGVYDYSLPTRRPENIPQSLKVDFAPNFSKKSPDPNPNPNSNSNPNPNRSSSNYRSQSRSDTMSGTNSMINNMISNHVNHTQTSSQTPMAQTPYSQTDHHQRHQQQYNLNIDLTARYKSPIVDNIIAYSPSNTNSRTIPVPVAPPIESQSRKDLKMPTIFGQKPEELKNLEPDERAFQNDANNKQAIESTSAVAYNKASTKINQPTAPTSEHNAQKKELANAYRTSSAHVYPNIQAIPVRQGDYSTPHETQSESIKLLSNPRSQSLSRPSETTTTEQQHKQPLPYPPYNHFDLAHRIQSQSAFNHSHSSPEYNVLSKTHDDRYKMGQPYMERSNVQYSSVGNIPLKRPSENGLIDTVPVKQQRYNHIDDIKYQQNVNNNPYYPHQDRNMAMYASKYAPNMKVSEKAISTPVIVQPQHANANEAKYEYLNMSNENKHVVTMRPDESYDQSKASVSSFRSSSYYSNHYASIENSVPYDDVGKGKSPMNPSAPYSQHNNVYTQPYRPNEWAPKTGNNESIGYGQKPSAYEHLPHQPNRFESSVIKFPEFSKVDPPPTEAFRTNATNNNTTGNINNNNNNNVPKAVDQSVISKLRNNLELKEIEKKKLLKTQTNNDKSNEEFEKSDLASILAARIRTKGELKGFTPIAVNDADQSTKEIPTVTNVVELSVDCGKIVQKTEIKSNDTLTGFDLMDWGSTCNDFLEQLQNNSDKQRSKAQRHFKLDDFSLEKKTKEHSISATKSGDNSNVENENHSERTTDADKLQPQNNDETSSDEDKPLLLLRQQSLSENSKNRKNLSSSDREKPSPNRKKTKLEKHSPSKRNDTKKRLAIESSSESEEEIERYSKRSKKMIRKPRTRFSINNQGGGDEDEDSDITGLCSSNKNENSLKKRNRKGKSSSESDIDANRNSKKRKSLEINSDSDDDNDDDEKDEDGTNSTKKRPQPMKIEETMTRSKRKRELEMEIANSKVLRNDKLVKCKSVTIEKRDLKSTQDKKTNSKLSEDKNNTKNTDDFNLQRSKSTDAKKKAPHDSDAEVTSKKSSSAKKNLRNSRQQSTSSQSESSSSSSASESGITERLRSRNKPKMNHQASDSEANKDVKNEKNKPGCSNSIGETTDGKTPNKKIIKNTAKKNITDLDMSEDSRSQFPPGWEEQAYEYKRSLKIPARLITIGRPSWHQHRKSTSLPDLDPQHSSDASETFAETSKKSVGGSSTKKNKSSEKKASNSSVSMNHDSDNAVIDSKSKSIIDLLHQRVIRPTVKSKKSRNTLGQNESKILPQSNEVELLPTPGSEGKPENAFKSESVFETAVLKSRTRKEYKAMKTQEIIREVFGGEDRPASAPPYNFDIVQRKLHQQQQLEQSEQQQPSPPQSGGSQQETKPLTFDQQYQQYLEKLNVDYGEKIRKVKSIAGAKIIAADTVRLITKTEKTDDDSLLNQDEESHDTELNDCERNIDDSKECACDLLERGDTPSVMSEIERATPTSFSGVLKTKKGRGNRYGRRKGSSGMQ